MIIMSLFCQNKITKIFKFTLNFKFGYTLKLSQNRMCWFFLRIDTIERSLNSYPFFNSKNSHNVTAIDHSVLLGRFQQYAWQFLWNIYHKYFWLN